MFKTGGRSRDRDFHESRNRSSGIGRGGKKEYDQEEYTTYKGRERERRPSYESRDRRRRSPSYDDRRYRERSDSRNRRSYYGSSRSGR